MEARARDLRKMRKHLSAPGLLAVVRTHFERIKEPGRSCRHTLTDNLMCGLALFAFKYPSMLQFDEQHLGVAADPVLQHNLARWYGMATVPSDSSLRRRLDRVSPLALQRVFGRVFEVARRHKALTGFQAVGRALSAGRGRRHRAVCLGERVHCDTCCVKRHHDGRMTYYHQAVGGGVGASVAVGRRAAGTGTDSEIRWGNQERLRTAGGEPPIAGGTACASASEDGGVAGCTDGDWAVSAAVSGVGHALSDRGPAGLACVPVRRDRCGCHRASGSRTIARRVKHATGSCG